MTIKRETLEAAASAGILKYAQIDNLLVFLVKEDLKKTRAAGSGHLLSVFLAGVAMVLALGHLAWTWVQDEQALVLVLAAQCLAVLALAMWCWRSRQANAKRLTRALRARYRLRDMMKA